MAKKLGPGKCVHCLKDVEERNSDHVFPESWYPDSTPPNLEKWQIPSCIPCNTDYGKLEQDFLLKVGGLGDRWEIPGERMAVLIPKESFERITKKIVRGIFFIEDSLYIQPASHSGKTRSTDSDRSTRASPVWWSVARWRAAGPFA